MTQILFASLKLPFFKNIIYFQMVSSNILHMSHEDISSDLFPHPCQSFLGTSSLRTTPPPPCLTVGTSWFFVSRTSQLGLVNAKDSVKDVL